MKKVIEEDKDNAKINEAIDFMEQAKLGNIEVKFEEKPEQPKKESKPKKKSIQEIMKDIDAIRE